MISLLDSLFPYILYHQVGWDPEQAHFCILQKFYDAKVHLL